jgi:FtsP/CotA-like multicopper oxidase with cupredoxin domain
MRATNTKSLRGQTLRGVTIALGSLLAVCAHAAAPGITGGKDSVTGGPLFNLNAAAMRNTQPNGKSLYTWGYGCSKAPSGFAPNMSGANCPAAQMPGPTLIVTEGDLVTVVLTNNLPGAAGNTSILFPGFQVASTGGKPGLLSQEAPNAATCNVVQNPTCNTVTYTFKAASPGTHSYYSGTQADLQVEMGLFGALIVLPANVPAVCNSGLAAANLVAEATSKESDFRLAHAAYDHPSTCYDREYLFQFSEMDDSIHTQAEQQVLDDQAKQHQQDQQGQQGQQRAQEGRERGGPCRSPTGCLVIATEPYTPGYFLVNGRSMPDDMDPNYAPMYPNQPYNGNPHMHPGELTLVRIIGQGRWQHPFHEHANHVRVLARDGNLLLTAPAKVGNSTVTLPAGPLMFTTTTTPGMTLDGIFYWTGKGLNWDVFGHGYAGDPSVCIPDANGYYTADPTAPNYYEWCGDHVKALEKHPFGQVAPGGPVTLPDPNIVTNGNWYAGSPYLGGEANVRAVGATPIPPSGTVANSPTGEAGYAFMWHSHNEREITTDNVFPGGMMMMMLVDPRSYVIDETN